MSYCRWSSDDFACDVYVYQSCTSNFLIHVASNRVVYAAPLPPRVELSPGVVNQYVERLLQVTDIIHKSERQPIGLPHDGETFCTDTPGECADQLEYLRSVGYNVPQHAIDALRDEQAT